MWSGMSHVPLSLCYSIVFYYNGAQWCKQFFACRSTVSGFVLAWFSSLSSESLCVFGIHGAIYICIYFFLNTLHLSLYLLVS